MGGVRQVMSITDSAAAQGGRKEEMRSREEEIRNKEDKRRSI